MSLSPSTFPLSALLLSAASLFGQSPVWQPPTNGFLYDAVTQGIRSIIGIPGSSYAGPLVQKNVDWASIAPNGRSGLVLRNGHLYLFQDFTDTNRNPITLDFEEQPTGCVWSDDSTRAVILLQQSNSIAWVSGLDAAPSIDGRRDLSSIEVTDWSLLAADSKAESIVLTAKLKGDSTIWMASSTMAPAKVGVAQRPVAAAFSKKSGIVYLADSAAHVVYQIRSQTDPILEVLLTADDGVGELAGVLVSNNEQLFLADAAAQSIRLYDLNTRASLISLDLYDDPAPITPIGPNRFLVNSRKSADQPFRFLDTSGPLKIVFIPAGESL